MNYRNRISGLVSFVLMTAILTAGGALADIHTFTAFLSGANEVPPVVSPASGFATLTVDTDGTLNIPLHVEFTGLTSAQTAAHIHTGSAGVNGPVVFTAPVGSPVDAIVPFDITMYANLAGGNLYFNVHTQNFPGGEIRGQFLLTDTVADESTSWGSVKTLFR